jgi:MYXO-CTERM domain-containing protein
MDAGVAVDAAGPTDASMVDAAPPTDAANGHDGASMGGTPDAATAIDSSTPDYNNPEPTDTNGCGCRAAGARSTATWPLFAAGAVGMIVALRARRRRVSAMSQRRR